MLVAEIIGLVLTVVVFLLVTEFQDPANRKVVRQDTIITSLTAIPAVAGLICGFKAIARSDGIWLIAAVIVTLILGLLLLALFVIGFAETKRFQGDKSG